MPLFNASIDLDKNELQNAVIHVSSGKPSTPKLGQIFFDSDVNQIQVCTNASGPVWQGLVSEVVDTDDIFNTGLRIGRDSHNMFDFETADNTIDIYLDNAKDFTFTANTFTAQSGSTIAGQVITGTTIDATTDFTIGNLVITDNTLTGTAIAIAGGSGEIDLTTSGAMDLNSAAFTLDGTTISIDGTDDVNLTVTSSTAGEDLTIAQIGANDSSIIITAAGTGTDAVKIDATAGDMLIAPALIDGKTLKIGPNGATEMVFTPSGTAGSEKISLINTSGTADDAIKIDSVAGGLTLAAGNDSLIIDADGTDADAINIDSAGGIDIDAADEIVITTTSADGHISLVSAHTAGQAIHLDGDANAGSIVDIDAGILDIDVTAGVTLDATTMSIDGTDDSNITVTGSAKDLDLIVAGGGTQELRLTSAGTGASALDLTTSAGGIDINSADMITVDAADEIVVTTTSADGHISLVTAHTAGQALHIDANANAGSIVDIDAGILDIDVTGVSTIDTTLLTLTGAGGLKILDTTASSATEGGSLILANDDGAVMADNHRLGVIEFQGAEDTSNTLTTGARIEAICDAEWSASENGASLLFYTTDANAAQGVALTLDSDQKATFAAAVHVAGNLTVAGTTTTQNTVLIENTVTTLVFEGAEDDLHETTLKVVEPTADCTFSLPTLTAGNFFLPAIADTATDASAAVTAAEFALLDGGSTIGTTAIVDADGIFSNNGGAMMHTQVTTYQTYFDANSVGGSNIVTTGTIGTGVWNGTVVASAYLDADTAHLSTNQTFTGTKTLNSFKGTGGATVTNILDEDAMGSNSATALATQQSIKAYADTKSVLAGSSSITTLGTIATGVWNGTAVASAYLDSDTAHLSGSQTFTGTKTLNSFKGTGGATVTNILDEDAMGSNSATALATQQSIKAYVDSGGASTSREKAFVLNESVDGVATTDNITYTVTHSLNTRNVMVEVIRNGANSGTYQTVYTNIKRTTDDIITVVFGSARTAGNYTVMIQKIG